MALSVYQPTGMQIALSREVITRAARLPLRRYGIGPMKSMAAADASSTNTTTNIRTVNSRDHNVTIITSLM